MRVMGQSNKIATQFLCPSEEFARVGFAESPATSSVILHEGKYHAKDWSFVQQDRCAPFATLLKPIFSLTDDPPLVSVSS